MAMQRILPQSNNNANYRPSTSNESETYIIEITQGMCIAGTNNNKWLVHKLIWLHKTDISNTFLQYTSCGFPSHGRPTPSNVIFQISLCF